MESNFAATLDVRQFLPRDKHALIFAIWNALPSGAHMLLVNDHDPKPLYYQLSAEHPGAFTWSYIEEGPERWQVALGKA